MNKREISASWRLKIIMELLIDLSVPILFTIIILIRKKTIHVRKEVLFFLFMGFAASFPLIISLKQSKFYLVPSLPFYAMAFAGIWQSSFEGWLGRIKNRTLSIIQVISLAIIVLSTTVMTMNYGKITRDHEIIKCAKINLNHIDGHIINVPDFECYDWTLVAYMMRISKISLSCDEFVEPLCY